ncbi:WAP four-disulfide core domain protein 2-like isoform X1 [Pomacea canaliculata]|uniref:WAP four-disulfide core domain protein 2-like isoform X1 n=1 Tax=Pomacea canaliculata TaxID=400727 RepID=UPI000D734BB7|nr:WAP four-disulfide core domain protein 2-like isoform X1 [Pomacea canaliculata]
MILLFLLSVLVTVTYVQASSQSFSTCAVTLCVTNSVCREVLNTTSGVISAVCLDPTLYPVSTHDKVCTDGQPLWVVSPTGGYSQAACGRVVDRTTCPNGYRCVIAPNDAYSLCCPAPVKSGQCPVLPPDSSGICASNCQSDSDCDDDLKCCRNPCGALTCQSPDVTTAVTCELVDCQPDKICIDTPTGPECVFPKREGKCPAPRISGGYPGCQSRCHKDADCPFSRNAAPSVHLRAGENAGTQNQAKPAKILNV